MSATHSSHPSGHPGVQRWLDAIAELASNKDFAHLAVAGHSTRELWSKLEQAGLAADILGQTLARAIDVPWVTSLVGVPASPDFVQKVPIGLARRQRMLGLEAAGDALPVIIADPDGWSQLDVVARYMGRAVEPRMGPAAEILAAINVAYQHRGGQTEQLIQSLDAPDVLAEVQQVAGRDDLLDVSGSSTVIKLVNLTLFDAVQSRASDVHVQPYEDRLVIRLRIDGVLFDMFEIPKSLQEEVISRVKIIGKMNIAEKRLPQDGRATVQVGNRLIDLRLASMPTSYGERVVIRILDKSARLYTLGELGMPAEILHRFRQLIELEHGLVLVTGPTGAGKSTTLYAALQEINTKDNNVVTLEDPIEYELPGISQTQVNEKKGLTFVSGLRNVLRQDPDIIMVGEIRDHETAEMAIQSALTGHVVFSTLHTNDASSAVTRLLDLGIEPYLVASSLIGVLAQRLVRRICPACIAPVEVTPAQLAPLGIDPAQLTNLSFSAGRGCSSCRQTGYHGRVGIFELMIVEGLLRDLIQQRANASQLREAARKRGLRLLHEDGVDKISSGETTVEEVVRVAMWMLD